MILGAALSSQSAQDVGGARSPSGSGILKSGGDIQGGDHGTGISENLPFSISSQNLAH